ncbi:extracellular solute-binding protein, partial [Phytoactinopolyspora endophytica]|uniref:extracellular solute-binding protein n=1 Tax=Phytoactinopolyspora endophytica TaxID=1642495 RepID=UPI00101CFDAF
SPAEDDALNSIIDSYNEQSTNTARFNPVPEYDAALQAALAGGSPPDVIYVDSNRLPDLVEAGALAPADGRLENEDDFYDSLRDAFTYDGTFWCPPKDFSTLALVYNVDMFEEAGVEPPTDWEELAAAAEALTDGDRAGLALGPEYPRWGSFMFQAGGAVTDDAVTEMTIDSDANREAFEYLRQFYADGYAATPTDLDAGWAGEAFGQGRAAMTIEGNWTVAAMNNDFPDVNWAVAELPVGPGGPGTFAFTVCYAVPSASENPDAAWNLVNYLVSDDVLLEFTEQFPVVPGRESLADEWTDAHPELGAFVDGAEYARPFQFVPGFAGVVDTLDDGIQGIAAGNREVGEVIQQVDESGRAALGG